MLCDQPDIFALPVLDKWLVHAPGHGLSALVDERTLRLLRTGEAETHHSPSSSFRTLVSQLGAPARYRPAIRTGGVTAPLFLGLIPTRGCMLGCRYCDFALTQGSAPAMSPELAAAAITGYLSLLQRAGQPHGEIHFFGGEPFAAAAVVQFAVEFARLRAAELNIELRYEVITNGFFNTRLADWIGGRFDTVIISLDGPEMIHDRYRPTTGGRGSFSTVYKNALRLAKSDAELILRACVTAESVDQLPAMAHWLAQSVSPSAICFERLTNSPHSLSSGIEAPDPWIFAARFLESAAILDGYGIQAVHSTTMTDLNRVSFCPVGHDALIVSPDGRIATCYLLPEDWENAGYDMVLGQINLPDRELIIDEAAVQTIRQTFQVDARAQCAHCFCRYHCCGGCHVHHPTDRESRAEDPICIQTRIITTGLLLRRLGQDNLLNDWLGNPAEMAATIDCADDHLVSEACHK